MRVRIEYMPMSIDRLSMNGSDAVYCTSCYYSITIASGLPAFNLALIII